MELSAEQAWVHVIRLCVPLCHTGTECQNLVGKIEDSSKHIERSREQEAGGETEVVPKANWVSVLHSSIYLSNYAPNMY